ncbi:MAG: type IV pilus assembly protein PilM [Candidatus Dojkabacteria bacterium]
MADIPPFFGLNLGHHSLKVAQLKYNGSQVKLETLSSQPTAIGMLDNDSEQGSQKLSEEILKAIKASNIGTKNSVMSVPEVAVYSRLLSLPKVKDEETEEAIHFSLKSLLPVPLEGVNVSYLDIDEKKLEGNTFVNWYVVAAPKQLISRYQDVMNKAGIELLAIETESLAIIRLIAHGYQIPVGQTTMVVDFGAENTNIILARNSGVIFSQSVGTGSNAVTKVISSDFGLDPVQAEKYKVTYGLDFSADEGKIAKSIEPIVGILISEIGRTLTYYQEKIGGESIKTIFITGGGSGLPKLDEYVKSKANIETVVVDPLKNIQVEGSMVQKVKEMNVRSFNVALGLALKGLSNR